MLRLLLLAVVASALLSAPTAFATMPAKTDVMLLFDTTGSMDDALYEAQDQIATVMDRLSTTLPDAQFALASVRDYPGVVNPEGDDYGDEGDEPFSLVQPMTADRVAMRAAIEGLIADNGGDGPEAYGRALLEADLAPSVGWRPGARRVAVMVADSMPHDGDLNEGIPQELQVESSPYDTGADPGRDVTLGTPDDIDWQGELQQLNLHGLPLMYVLYHGSESRLEYWRIWARLTGGDAVNATDAESSTLADSIVTAATQGATAPLPPCPAGQDRGTDGTCRDMPVIFLPGIMGSEIWCGERKLWFNYRIGTGINHREMLLADDGSSPRDPKNACNASAGAKSGAILRSAGFGKLQQDAYGSMADFLDREFPGRTSFFAYDWRKSPASAVASLDAVVDGLRRDHGGVRALIVAHSMGGLVTQEYVGDRGRAAKIARVVTIGTPYWGAPKSVLPLARGDTEISPWPSADTLLDNDEVRDLASNMAGLYALFPSDAWHQHVGDWLTVREASKTPAAGAGATADALDKAFPQTNPTLYRNATAEHHLIDGWRTNGVGRLAIVGAGKATVGKVSYDDDLFEDDWDFTWTNGDQTVPLLSAAQGAPTAPPLGDPVTRRYVCDVEHGKETGHPTVQSTAAFFLRNGSAAELEEQPCAADKEDEIDLRMQPKGGRAARAVPKSRVTVVVGGRTLSLADAEAAGAVDVLGDADQGHVTVVAAHGTVIRATGTDVTAAVAAIAEDVTGPATRFGPVDGTLTVVPGPAPTASRGGKRLRRATRDLRAPSVRVRVRVRRRTAVVRIAASDAAGVRTLAVEIGGRRRVFRGGRAVVRLTRLPRRGRAVRWQASDAFGNISRRGGTIVRPRR